MRYPFRLALALAAVSWMLTTASATAQQDAQNLAKQLANPIASLISVPIQYNFNQNLGTGNGVQNITNIQPVIPFSISPNWNVISRTIVPIVSLHDLEPGYGTKTGFGNTIQSFFFSPKAPTSGGLIWGVGPVIQLPTSTDSNIAPYQWGGGITAVALKQTGGWTYGGLINQIWSIGKSDEYGEASNMFVQPFVAYTTKRATSIGLNTESTYDWEAEEWSVPINLTVGQIVKLGRQPVQLTGGVRYWADSPEGGAEDWGARVQVTFLFPK
jgi:hypothetical protein